VADCWPAAENLLFAVCVQDSSTCILGFSVSALNTPEWKAELKKPGWNDSHRADDCGCACR